MRVCVRVRERQRETRADVNNVDFCRLCVSMSSSSSCTFHFVVECQNTPDNVDYAVWMCAATVKMLEH